jgi:hypothetical protein
MLGKSQIYKDLSECFHKMIFVARSTDVIIQ